MSSCPVPAPFVFLSFLELRPSLEMPWVAKSSETGAQCSRALGASSTPPCPLLGTAFQAWHYLEGQFCVRPALGADPGAHVMIMGLTWCSLPCVAMVRAAPAGPVRFPTWRQGTGRSSQVLLGKRSRGHYMAAGSCQREAEVGTDLTWEPPLLGPRQQP